MIRFISMDGVEYFGHFETMVRHIDRIDASEHLVQSGGGLAIKLAELYFGNEIEFIGADPEPELIEDARQTITETGYSQTGKSRIGTSIRIGKHNLEKMIRETMERGVEGITDPEELKMYATVAAERDCLYASIASHHDGMLSKCLIDIQKLGKKDRHEDAERISGVVKQAINGQRRQLAEMLDPWQMILLAHYDRTRRGKFHEYKLDIIRAHNKPIPGWIGKTDNPDGPGQLLASLVSETETLVAINEWVVARRLPYLPVISPVFYEAGPFDRESGNPHADLLLCSLLPGRNDIIPVQVKKSIKPVTKADYIEQMVFLTPQDLGQFELSHPTIRVEDRVETGNRYTARYGSISTQFIKLNTLRKGKQPTKVDKKVYTENLERAFQGLDNVLGELVA